MITKKHWQGGGTLSSTTLPNPHPAINLTHFCRWYCSHPHTITEAIQVMTETCPAYNAFEVGSLDLYAEELKNAQIFIAREGSVCFYIAGIEGDEQAELALRNLSADEIDLQGDGIFRVWWD
jgi:hypothetical protein